MVAHYLFTTWIASWNGLFRAKFILNIELFITKILVERKGKNQPKYKDIAIEKYASMLQKIPDITFQLKKFSKRVKDNGIKTVFDIEVPLVRCLCKMEKAGVRIDSEAL